jgi:hypothetical protein
MARPKEIDGLKNLFSLNGKCSPPLDADLHKAVTYGLSSIKGKIEVPFTVANREFQKANVAHWIIKLRVNSKYKHPLGDYSYLMRNYAEVYAAVFDACEKLHTYGGGDEYRNASQWFSHILNEFALCRSQEIGKKKAIAEIRKQNSSLTKIKYNSALKTDKGKLSPDFELNEIYDKVTAKHTYKLFHRLCTPLLDPNYDVFRIKLLSNIIDAMKTFITWSDQVVGAVYCAGGEGQKDFVVSGKGKSHKKLENVLIDSATLSLIGLQTSNDK